MRDPDAIDRFPGARTDDDRSLWDQTLAGDADAFGVLYERHHQVVYNFCFRRTGSWSQAEDLTAATFLEAWRTRRPLEIGASGVVPWLIGIATNLTSSQRRAAARRVRLLEQVAEAGIPVADDFADDVAGRVDDERRMREVLTHLRQLPQRDQDVIAACAFAGLDYQGAADALDVPVGTVRSRLSRARSRLAARMEMARHQQEEL